MSNSRRQIEAWLKTLVIKGSALDVGGLFWPVMNRTAVWDVDDYCIADVREERRGFKTHMIWDFNRPLPVVKEYDHVFAIEVTDHLWNTDVAFDNLSRCTKRGGKLYLSSNFLFPHHTGFDCIRLTRSGLEKLLTENGFKVLSITPRMAVDETLHEAMKKESKVVYYPGEIGYMVVAQKC